MLRSNNEWPDYTLIFNLLRYFYVRSGTRLLNGKENGTIMRG